MCMSCNKTNILKNNSKTVNTSNKGVKKTYMSAPNNPFGSPKVRISFANRKT